ncbi:MAG: hypothetical protein LBJ46_06010, partial [Planctomycetota bacterium]|nr:hypothetical protein [Planctomycetota bacterium]
MTKDWGMADRSGGTEYAVREAGRTPAGIDFTKALLLTVLAMLMMAGGVWAATPPLPAAIPPVNVEYNSSTDAYQAYQDRDGRLPNDTLWLYNTDNLDTTNTAEAYRIDNGQLFRTRTRWSWSVIETNGTQNRYRADWIDTIWELMPWEDVINVTNDDRNPDVPDADWSYGNAEGTNSTSVFPKGSGNTLNLSGRGTVSGTLDLFDDDVNPNTVRFGIVQDVYPVFDRPDAVSDGDYYTATVLGTFQHGGGSISGTGTLRMGYGTVEMYGGEISSSGILDATTDALVTPTIIGATVFAPAT